ncbi:hypothetical protein [Crenothrix sp.]|uniref:hypothetical protein n=1 Tax=Crenothrix sp. TaxID=3100433 RepID=UPI00374D5A3D
MLVSFKTSADWLANLGNSVHYTDDVALFSVTRRLSLKDDPTQPVVDRPSQGGDFVYDPSATLEWTGKNTLGKLLVAMDAGGYVFAEQSAFSHGLYEFRLAQTFADDSKISLHYNFVPDLFLGKNTLRQVNTQESEHDEILSNHYWSVRLDHPLTRNITVRLLGRYGLRHYNAPFQHRDTQFWTLGPHLEWAIHPGVELLLGYHYERGVADHQKAINVDDDISYVNHYASAELKLQVLEKLSAIFIFDYEKNAYTSQYVNDEHRGASENLFQGEIELLYELDKSATIKLGWQHGSRKLTSEAHSVNNNNIWLGVDYAF